MKNQANYKASFEIDMPTNWKINKSNYKAFFVIDMPHNWKINKLLSA